MVNQQPIETILEVNNIPKDSKKIVLVGDVSATNILLALVAETGSGERVTVRKVHYRGQELPDFKYATDFIVNDTGLNEKDIYSAVLSPAGPIRGRRCNLTNNKLTVDLDEIRLNRSVLINDFLAIGYAIADPKTRETISRIQLRHSDGNLGEVIENANIGIGGAGTGFGVGRLIFDHGKRMYLPAASEGGHKFLTPNVLDPTDVEMVQWLGNHVYQGCNPHLEAVLSGKGLENVMNFLIQKYRIHEEKDMDEYKKAEDKARHIASKGKSDPVSLFGAALLSFYGHYGMALRDIAVHELAQGGVYIAGGAIRKDIPESKGSTKAVEWIEGALMNSFDNGPTHQQLVRNIPVYAITDSEIGLKGTIAVALNQNYLKMELAKTK